MAKDNSPARGMRDFLPAQSLKRAQILEAITDVYTKYGFEKFETPVVEDISRLTAGSDSSENQKLIYQILKRGLDNPVPGDTPLEELVDAGLRFDLTVPLARFYANNQANLRLPFKGMQVGPVFRAERPQKGRYRQFVQCDIDIVGDATPMAEAQLIEASTEALTAIGIPDLNVRISDRRILTAMFSEAGVPAISIPAVSIILDKLDKIGWDGVQDELANKSIDSETISKLVEVVTVLSDLDAADVSETLKNRLSTLDLSVIDDFQFTLAATEAIASERLSVTFDPTLVRGMGYYTGQIIEITTSAFDSTICGGGRYDNLIGTSVGKDVPAVGVSIGFERIIDVLGDVATGNETVILYAKEIDPSYILNASRQLRSKGLSVSAIAMTGASVNKQLDRMKEWGFSSYVLLRDADQEVDSLVEQAIN